MLRRLCYSRPTKFETEFKRLKIYEIVRVRCLEILLKHLFTLLTVVLAAAGCGNSNNPGSELNALDVAQPTFTLACSVSPLDDTPKSLSGIRSVRVTHSNGRVSMRLDQNNADLHYTAVDSTDVSVSDDHLAAAWTAGEAGFAASEFARNIFSGELQLAGATIQVKCIKFVTDDRDDDEFSLACTATEIASKPIGQQAVIRDVVLSYEERELEMFINPTGEREIFDLERASDVRVTNLEVSGEWASQHTWFDASSHDGDRFEAVLNLYGSATNLVCWKI